MLIKKTYAPASILDLTFIFYESKKIFKSILFYDLIN